MKKGSNNRARFSGVMPAPVSLMVTRNVVPEELWAVAVSEGAEIFSVATVNIPFGGTLGVEAKSEHRVDRRPYQEVFNDQQRRIVEKAFAKEIQLHGYRFEQ